MNRTYEAMVLLDNREVKKGWQNLKEQVCGVFQKHGAEIKSARRWDERRLAYPVKHQLRGTYMLLYFDADTDALTPIRRDLEYTDPVLRCLTTVCETIPESAFEPEAEFDESQIRVEDTATERAAVEEASAERPRRSTDRRSVEKKSTEKESAEKKSTEKESAEKPAEDQAKDSADPKSSAATAAPAEASGDAASEPATPEQTGDAGEGASSKEDQR